MNRMVGVLLRNWWRLPGIYIKLSRYARRPEAYPEQERWNYIQWVLALMVKSGNVDLELSGVENLPAEGGCILYSNHQGIFDVVAIGSTCPIPLGAVYKKELTGIPLLAQILKATKSFSMDREDVRQSLTVIRSVTEEVLAGRNYLIFPEGTRSKNGNRMGPFHPGSFRAAMKAGCPVVPVALRDCHKVFDQKGSQPLKVQLQYLKPISPAEYAGMKTVELAELVKDRIAQALGEDAICCEEGES